MIKYVYELQVMYLDEMLARWGHAIPHEDDTEFLDKIRGITYVDSRAEGGYFVEMSDELLAL